MNLLEQATQPRVPSYKEIPLTRGMVALVDAADYDLLARHKWQAHRGLYTWYARRCIVKGGRCFGILMHREILGFPPDRIDHEDRNGLHNWWFNLRTATQSQNGANRQKQANNTSGFKGVYWHAGARKWMAAIGVAQKQIYLGLRDTREEAAALYAAAAKEAFGEFARI